MLLDGLRKLTMRYAPLLPGNGSIAQLYAHCTTKKARKSNPECSVDLTLLDQGDPILFVEFANGDKFSVATKTKTTKELEGLIKARKSDIRTMTMLREEGYCLEKLKLEEVPDLKTARAMAKPKAKRLYDAIASNV